MTIKNDDSNTQFPADFEAQAKIRFEASEEKEQMGFDQFLIFERIEFMRLAAIAANPGLVYKPKLGAMTVCGNGDFNEALNPSEWQGAYGSFSQTFGTTLPLGSTINFGALNEGILPGAIDAGTTGSTATQAHQQWVSAGPDPIVPTLNRTSPGSSGAVRIGNVRGLRRVDLLSKTFLVNSAKKIFNFWYAVVFQDPGENSNSQPFFWVRVTDASGNIISGAFDFGGGSDKLVSDPSNPFFSTQSAVSTSLSVDNPGTRILYKDWSAAQIDLTSVPVGTQVTIEFISADCGGFGHWGYAYIDSFCGDRKGSPTGSITYDCKSSKHCGKGEICFDYELPKAEVKDPKSGALTTITGNVEIMIEIMIEIMQGGVVIDKFGSGLLSSGCSYCFTIDPATIAGIDPTLGGFDFVATGQFSITNTAGSLIQLGSQSMGGVPDGMILGTNNDYKIVCKSCEEIKAEQDAALAKRCANKVNQLQSYDCQCPEGSTGGCGCGCSGGCGGKATASNALHAGAASKSGCGCGGKSKDPSAANAASTGHAECEKLEICADLRPDISISWGDSKCDCLETDDVEVLCVTVCNPYSNITYADLTIGQVVVTNMDGTPVPNLPDGTPSVQVFPSGGIGFGDIGPCHGKNSNCVTRELVLYTRGAIGRDYRLSFAGICATIQHAAKSEACFVLPLCADE